jgi:mercuric ion transport protein
VLPVGPAGVACAACCILPGLIAAGQLAGGGVIGAVLGWLPEVAIALVAVAAVVFLLKVRARCAHACGRAAGSGMRL